MITARVTGGPEVSRKLKAFPVGAQELLRQSMGQLILKLERRVKQDKLTGQVLHVRTGRLRRSIHSRVTDDQTSVTGTVGTNVQYAAAHEYGYQGTETVKQHLRTIKQAFGRQIAPTSVMVSAHSRTVNLPERSFLRSALEEMSPSIKADLEKAMNKAIGRWDQ